MRVAVAVMVTVLCSTSSLAAERREDSPAWYSSWDEMKVAATAGDPVAQWRLAAEWGSPTEDPTMLMKLADEGHCQAMIDAQAEDFTTEAALTRAAASGCREDAVAALVEQQVIGFLPRAGSRANTLTEMALRGNAAALRAKCELAARRAHPDLSSLRFCRAAAANGDAHAAYLLGRLLHHRADDNHTRPNTWQQVEPKITFGAAAALPFYRQAAETGHAAAQGRLARLLATGTGLPRNDAQAVFWAEKAAEQADPEGMSIWGLILLQGRGVTAAPDKALRYIESAARRGDVTAQCTLATLHMRGAHVPRDYIKGMMWILLPRLAIRPLPDEAERRGLMLEPPERTLYAVDLIGTPASYLEAFTRAAQLRKELTDSGEWPLVDPIPAAFPPQK